MRLVTMIFLLALALATGIALPESASAEAKQKPGVIKEVEPAEPAAPSQIEVIRRVKVQKSLPMDNGTLTQSKGTNRTSSQPVTIRRVTKRG